MNATDTKLLLALTKRLKRIAEKNDDEFKIDIKIDPASGYCLEVIETADNHTFLFARGPSIKKMIRSAAEQIPGALEKWGYSE